MVRTGSGTLTSIHPDIEIPDQTLHDFLFAGLDDEVRRATAFAATADSPPLTYGELADQVAALAGALAHRSLGAGDVVAILAPNSAGFAVALHGALRAGCTVTPVNALATAVDVRTQLVDANVSVLVTVSDLLRTAREAIEDTAVTADALLTIDETPGITSVHELVRQGYAPPEVGIDPASAVAVLPYSSGTTGRPKGVMLTHRNLVANLCQVAPWMGVSAEDRVLAVLPFFHIYGLNVVLNLSLAQRSTVVTMPRFDLAQFLARVEDERCTFLYVAPPVAVALAKHPQVEDHDLSSVTTVISGAAPLDAALGREVERRVGCTVRQGYGMSELSPVSHLMPHDRSDIDLSSIGLTLPNVECRVVDPVTHHDVDVPESGPSRPGELWCRGPNVMVGYLGNPKATDETIDAEGFLHTGDLVTVDARGVITVVDRLKELIKYKGYQVAPAELEALLLTHEAIADAAVIGVAGQDGEEVPKAFIVPRPGSSLSEEEVMTFVAARVAPYKKVRVVELIDVVPKSAAGKILRRELRAR